MSSLFDEKLRSPTELVAGVPQNLDDLDASNEESEALLDMIHEFDEVRPKVDFSDFSNFVFFNSALDYFNLTGEKILNEYPYDGSETALRNFLSSLDDYQRYVVGQWPSTFGSLKFDSSAGFSNVSIDDIGKDGDVTRTSLLNIGSSSFSFEFWTTPPKVLTGSEDIMIVAQKTSNLGDGFTVFFSGSNVYMSVVSGSSQDVVSSYFEPETINYFCFSYDRNSYNPILSCFSGSADKFPVLSSKFTGSITKQISTSVSKLTIGSGSALPTKVLIPLSASIDEVRFWKKTRTISDLSSSFNSKIYSQEGLTGLWNFNEPGNSTLSDNMTVKDHSGHKLNGTINGYYSGIRYSGSLLPFDEEDLFLSFDNPTLTSFVASYQASGSLFDKFNDNAIIKLVPDKMISLEDDLGTDIAKNLLFVIARFFDNIKVSIDQFSNVLIQNYGKFNQTPDALLKHVGSFFGWEFTGNFIDKDVIQYIVGKHVLPNTQSNKKLDKKLFEIRNEFWKRTLLNLMHLYKTKGTRESVESLLRIYGVNSSFVKLKEHGAKPNVGVQTYRINSNKSAAALSFSSGSAAYSNVVESAPFYSNGCCVETRLRFPTQFSSNVTSSFTTGSIWEFSNALHTCSLTFTKQTADLMTGSLIYSGSEGIAELSNANIFDNKWYNVVVNKNLLSSSVDIDVRMLDIDEISLHMTASLFADVINTSSVSSMFRLGSANSLPSEMWAQEVRVWNEHLSQIEMQDHALNFQSFGTEEVNGLDELCINWKLNEDVTSSFVGGIPTIYDHSGNGNNGVGSGFMPDINSFKKFLNDFNYVASPDYSWNEEKIRSFEKSSLSPEDAFSDDQTLVLEFNLVDALNEDISQILSTLDTFNEFLAPVNRFREEYQDLDVLRRNYFKRLSGRINFRLFADLLEFFDRSFIDMVRKLIPARANFLGDELVVESHMLERPKMQWNYRRRDPDFEPEGVIRVYIRA